MYLWQYEDAFVLLAYTGFIVLVYWGLMPQQQPGSYRGHDDDDDDDDEMSV